MKFWDRVFVMLAVLVTTMAGLIFADRQGWIPRRIEVKAPSLQAMPTGTYHVTDRDVIPLFGLAECVDHFGGRLALPAEADGTIKVFATSLATIELELERDEVELGRYVVERDGDVVGWDIGALDRGPKRRLWKEDFIEARDQAFKICGPAQKTARK